MKLSAKRNVVVVVTPPDIPAFVFATVVFPVSCCTSLKKNPAGAATPFSANACGFNPLPPVPPLLKLHEPPPPGVAVAVAVAVDVAVAVAVDVAAAVGVDVAVAVEVAVAATVGVDVAVLVAVAVDVAVGVDPPRAPGSASVQSENDVTPVIEAELAAVFTVPPGCENAPLYFWITKSDSFAVPGMSVGSR